MRSRDTLRMIDPSSYVQAGRDYWNKWKHLIHDSSFGDGHYRPMADPWMPDRVARSGSHNLAIFGKWQGALSNSLSAARRAGRNAPNYIQEVHAEAAGFEAIERHHQSFAPDNRKDGEAAQAAALLAVNFTPDPSPGLEEDDLPRLATSVDEWFRDVLGTQNESGVCVSIGESLLHADFEGFAVYFLLRGLVTGDPGFGATYDAIPELLQIGYRHPLACAAVSFIRLLTGPLPALPTSWSSPDYVLDPSLVAACRAQPPTL